MKIRNAIGKLFGSNEIIALWVKTNKWYRALLWRGSAWKLPSEYKKLKIQRFFGTIPETICKADTINILIKSKSINVDCATCSKRKQMSCPSHSKCMVFVDKPHWEWNKDLKGMTKNDS